MQYSPPGRSSPNRIGWRLSSPVWRVTTSRRRHCAATVMTFAISSRGTAVCRTAPSPSKASPSTSSSPTASIWSRRAGAPPRSIAGWRHYAGYADGRGRARGGCRAGCPADAHGAQPTALRSDRYRSSCIVARGWRLLTRPCRQKLRAGPTHAAGGTTCRRGCDIAYRGYYRERSFRYCAHSPRQRSQGARDTLERDGAACPQAISGRTPGVRAGTRIWRCSSAAEIRRCPCARSRPLSPASPGVPA